MTTTASFHDVIIASSPRRVNLTACLMILLLLLRVSAPKRGLLCNPSRLREDLLTDQALLTFSGKLRLLWSGAIGGFELLCLRICCLVGRYEVIEHLEIDLDKLGRFE